MAVGPNCANEKIAANIKKFEAEIDRWLSENYDGAGSVSVELSGIPLTGTRMRLEEMYRKEGWGSVQIRVDTRTNKAELRLYKEKMSGCRFGD